MVPHPEDAAAAAGKPAASPHPAPLAAPTLGSDFGKTHAREADRSWWKPFDQSVVAVQRADPIALQMAHFGAIVRGEAELLVGLRDGCKICASPKRIRWPPAPGRPSRPPPIKFFEKGTLP